MLLSNTLLYAFIGRIITSVGNLLIGILVAYFLSPASQGYYYVILSLCASYNIVDLGMTTAVLYAVSHEDAVDNVANINKIRAIVKKSLIWYSHGSILFALTSIIFGYIYFSGQNDSYLVWPTLWFELVFVISIEILLLSFMGVIEGHNQIRSIYRYRARKAFVLTASICFFIYNGLGLQSLALGYVLTWPISYNFIFKENRAIFELYQFKKYNITAIDNVSDFSFFHLQLAISYLAGFLATWAMSPLAVKLLGPVIGGKVGFTWSIGFGITTLAAIPLNVSQAHIARLAANGNRNSLDKYFIQVGGASIILSILGFLCALIFIHVVNIYNLPLAERLLNIRESALLFFGMLLTHLTLPLSTYIRAHKSEPLTYVSVVFTVVMILTTCILSDRFGTIGYITGYPLIAAILGFPWIIILFFRFRKEKYI